MKYKKLSLLMLFMVLIPCKQAHAMLGYRILNSLPLIDPLSAYAMIRFLPEFKALSQPMTGQEGAYEELLPTKEKEEVEALFKTEGMRLLLAKQDFLEETGAAKDVRLGIVSLDTRVLLFMDPFSMALFKEKDTALKEFFVRHELGHAVHRHVEKKMVMDVACDSVNVLNGFCFYKGLAAEQGNAHQILYHAILQFFECADSYQARSAAAALLVLLAQRTLCRYVKNTYSRYCEKQADNYAIQTGSVASVEAGRDFFKMKHEESFEGHSSQTAHPEHKERMKTFDKALESKQDKDTLLQGASINPSFTYKERVKAIDEVVEKLKVQKK